MTQPRFPDDLGFDPETMTRKAINAARVMMGVMGIIGVLIGGALLIWPGKSLGVLVVFAGIFFAITGAVRTAIGIFSRDVSSGSRILNIVLGLMLLLGGVIMLRHLATSTEVLTVMVVILIGIGWVIEGVATLAQAGRSSSSTMAYVRGTIGVIAGIVLIAVPTWSALALVIMTGITILLLGVVGIVQAFLLGKNLPPADAKPEHQVIDG